MQPIQRRYLITLSPVEEWHLKQHALARDSFKVTEGSLWGNHKRTEDIHYLGLRAECAVAKVLRVPFDLSLSLAGDKHVADLYARNGWAVSVKYAARRGWAWKLSSANYAEFKADIGVLCWPAENGAVELVGWITREKFNQVATVEDYGHGKRLKVEAAQMAHITDLILETSGYSLRAAC